MFRAAYLGILICIFTIAIAIPAMAQPSCEEEMARTFRSHLTTAALESGAPVVLLAASNPSDALFRDDVDTLVKKAANTNGYRFITEKTDTHPNAYLGDRLLRVLESGTDKTLLDEVKGQAGRNAFIVLNVSTPEIARINSSNDLLLPKKELASLHQLAEEWKKDGVLVRFFVRGSLHSQRTVDHYLSYSLQPVVSLRSNDYIPDTFDAVSVPARPRFINIGTQTLVLTYPN